MSELLVTHLGLAEILTRLGMAALIGFVVGLERELKSKHLGLRTNMLVAVGAALFGTAGAELVERYTAVQSNVLQFDPSRIVEGIITGIGFLGAGAIIQGQRDIHGGTTAASVWVLGGIGLSCGFGLYALAILGGVILLAVLFLLGFLADRLLPARAAQKETAAQGASPGRPSA